MAATVQGKKTPAKRTPPRPKAAPAEEAPAALRVVRLEAGAAHGPRVPLFYVGDREYTVPAKPGMNIALQVLHLRRTTGDDAAMDYMLDKVLGAEGYQALRECDTLDAPRLMQILGIVNELVMGALEAPKGQ